MTDLQWTWRDWKINRADAELESKALVANWPKLSDEDAQTVLSGFNELQRKYINEDNVNDLCHLQDSKGRYFRGHCKWLTYDELKAINWDGLTVFSSPAHALMDVKQCKAANHPDFTDAYEDFRVVPVLVEARV